MVARILHRSFLLIGCTHRLLPQWVPYALHPFKVIKGQLFQHIVGFCNRPKLTIIVIADIYRGLHSPATHINACDHPCLTFRHRSGVTPYTSSCEFAGSCVFVKQSPGNLSLRPPATRRLGGRPYPEVTAAFLPSSLRISHSFALVFSTLPPVSVCGTEPLRLTLEVFLGSVLPRSAWP